MFFKHFPCLLLNLIVDIWLKIDFDPSNNKQRTTKSNSANSCMIGFNSVQRRSLGKIKKQNKTKKKTTPPTKKKKKIQQKSIIVIMIYDFDCVLFQVKGLKALPTYFTESDTNLEIKARIIYSEYIQLCLST